METYEALPPELANIVDQYAGWDRQLTIVKPGTQSSSYGDIVERDSHDTLYIRTPDTIHPKTYIVDIGEYCNFISSCEWVCVENGLPPGSYYIITLGSLRVDDAISWREPIRITPFTNTTPHEQYEAVYGETLPDFAGCGYPPTMRLDAFLMRDGALYELYTTYGKASVIFTDVMLDALFTVFPDHLEYVCDHDGGLIHTGRIDGVFSLDNVHEWHVDLWWFSIPFADGKKAVLCRFNDRP